MIYRDKSVGNRIRISVVKLILLKDYESFAPLTGRYNKQKSVSASDMLKSFCKWQSQLTSDTDYYDAALLLTRYSLIMACLAL